jgi:site-specific recombinase XerD
VSEKVIQRLFFIGRTERKWSSNTFIVYHKTLLVFFRWCSDNGYLSKNPLLAIPLPKLEKKLPSKLTKQTALTLLEIVYNYPYGHSFLRYRNHAIFSVLIFAGIRKQELLNLKFADVDIVNLTIFIRQGKGAKDRIIPMSYTLAQTLQKYITERSRLRKTGPDFFSSLRFDTGLTANGLRRIVEHFRNCSGIFFTVHKLRHTFATLMLEGGCDIYSLSKMMGHSDIKTTTIYLSASAEHLRGQITKHPLNNGNNRLAA